MKEKEINRRKQSKPGKRFVDQAKEFQCHCYAFCNTKLTRSLPFARQQIRMKTLKLAIF